MTTSKHRIGFVAVVACVGVSLLRMEAGEVPRPPRLTNVQTLASLPNRPDGMLVDGEGDISFADGSRLGFVCGKQPAPADQRLRQGWMPIVETTREEASVRMDLTAFASALPGDLIRVAVANKTAAELAASVRIRADHPGGLLTFDENALQQDGKVFALLEPGGGVVKAASAKGLAYERRGGRPLPNWGHPKVPCDPAFSNIVAGFGEPATYRIKVDPAAKYVVAIGLCESHWGEPGQRIIDFLVDGQSRFTSDPVKEHGRDVPFVVMLPASDLNRDGILEVTAVANPKSPDPNSILNVLWVFIEADAKGLTPEEVMSGKANARAACVVDCGVEGPSQAMVQLDWQVNLPAKSGALLWIKKPLQPLPGDQAAPLKEAKPDELLAATEKLWTAQLDRATKVDIADARAAELYRASLANLLMLCSAQPEAWTALPGPRGEYRPIEAAAVASAFDQVGLHREAELVLADALAREAPASWEACFHLIFAATNHYERTKDKAWLERVYPRLLAGAEQIMQARSAAKWFTKDEADPHWGLLPARADGEPSTSYSLGDSLLAADRLQAIGAAAAALGRGADAALFTAEARDLAARVEKAAATVKPEAQPPAPDAGVFSPAAAWLQVQRLRVEGDKQRAAEVRDGILRYASPTGGWSESVQVATGRCEGLMPSALAAAACIVSAHEP